MRFRTSCSGVGLQGPHLVIVKVVAARRSKYLYHVSTQSRFLPLLIPSQNFSLILIMPPHPLQQLSVQESRQAKDILLASHSKNEAIIIREIFLHEPKKVELQKYLELEHSGSLTSTSSRPAREAFIQYDVLGSNKIPYFNEAVIDLDTQARTQHEVIGKDQHAPLKL